MSEAIKILDRILARCRRKPNGCLPCYMMISTKGYSNVRIGDKKYKTHRVIMHLVAGFDLDSDLPILHNDTLCSSRACVEFNHLRVGTYSENMSDVIDKQGHNNSFGRRKVFCPQGHRYDGITRSTGGQVCKICKKENNKNRSLKLRG